MFQFPSNFTRAVVLEAEVQPTITFAKGSNEDILKITSEVHLSKIIVTMQKIPYFYQKGK